MITGQQSWSKNCCKESLPFLKILRYFSQLCISLHARFVSSWLLECQWCIRAVGSRWSLWGNSDTFSVEIFICSINSHTFLKRALSAYAVSLLFILTSWQQWHLLFLKLMHFLKCLLSLSQNSYCGEMGLGKKIWQVGELLFTCPQHFFPGPRGENIQLYFPGVAEYTGSSNICGNGWLKAASLRHSSQ